MRYNLYYLFLEDKLNHPMPKKVNRKIRKKIKKVCRKVKPIDISITLIDKEV